MPNGKLNWRVFGDISWWHWVLTIPLLATHLAGYGWAIVAAMTMCAVAGLYFLARMRHLRPYPVQVRIAYLGILAIGLLPVMQWIYWIPLVGTTAMVVLGYCPLIRMLSLAPWNRREAFSLSLVWRAFAVEPCSGGLVQWSGASLSTPINCGSPKQQESSLSCSLDSCKTSPQERSHAPTY